MSKEQLTDRARLRSVNVLGVRVHDVTFEETLDLLETFVDSGSPHQVATVNPEFVIAARKDAEFRDVLNNRAALTVPDGVGILLASQLLRQPIRGLVPGSDLVPAFAQRSARRGDRWFLLGAAEGVAWEAAQKLMQSNPGLKVVGAYGGGPSPELDTSQREIIRRAGPVDVILVAYGAPGQDKWLARNLEPLGIPLGVGVGGVFNFLTGRSRIPPQWVQRIHFIWLFRLLTERWRWRRQLALPQFAWRVLLLALLRLIIPTPR